MEFHFKLVMPSDPRSLCIARSLVRELGSVCALPEESRQGMVLAIDEALANIIRHAYKNREGEEMELVCEVEADRIVFRLLDKGEAPDPARICAQPLDDVSLNGRGTHLIKAVMDEMTYERVGGKNQLRLVKRLPVDGKAPRDAG